MGFSSLGPRVWPVTPDWNGGVQESLGWGTDVTQASATAATHARSYRIGPRRSFSFEVLAWEKERNVLDMLLAGHRGSWLLPVWPDVQWMPATLSAGSDEIPCATAGYDFVAGGKALLYSAVNTWEVVGVEEVAPDHLALGAPTLAAYGRGSRLYPLRRAQLQDGAEAMAYNDKASRRRIVFDIAEPCDWPVLTGGVAYLDHPVLDVRPDESDDPASSFAGLLETVDFGAGIPVVSDLPRIALRAQRDGWKLFGRAQHSWFRSLLYTLRGRQRPIWVPSWSSDLNPAASIAGGGVSLSVDWCGYKLFGLGKPNRKDLRIELVDGTVHYRRVINAVEAGANETITLNASLDSASIAPGQIRQISIMSLATLASDSTEIDHKTDAEGLATSVTGWQGVVPNV